ncbi:MAG: hypothetical protein ABSE53_00255 [Terracidiphilus sp.]|jgi:hypothetical protein
MYPRYLSLMDALELLTFFVIAPALGIVVAYKVWREREHHLNAKKCALRCVAFGGTALLLFASSNWIGAYVRTAHSLLHFLQSACALLSFLSFGVCTGYFVFIPLSLWRRHKATRTAEVKGTADSVDPEI